MKKLTNLIIISFFIFSCNSEKDRVKENIKNYFNENINDPTKIEPVSYGEIESCPSCISLDSVPYEKDMRFTYRQILTNMESGVQIKRLVKVIFYLDSEFNIVSVVDTETKERYDINQYSH